MMNQANMMESGSKLISDTGRYGQDTPAGNCALIDIHSHVLFGIDDGSVDVPMSLSMLRTAYQQGVRAVFCTSHSKGNMEDYWHNLRILQERAWEDGIDIRLYPGCEISCTACSVEEDAEQVIAGYYPALANSEYVMLEFSPYISPDEMIHCVKIMIERTRKRVIVAHAERYFCLREDPAALETLESMECRFQVNAYSFENEAKSSIRNLARFLLETKRISFVGSDAHRPDHRPFAVKVGIRYIYEHSDRDYADSICFGNAEKLLINRNTE